MKKKKIFLLISISFFVICLSSITYFLFFKKNEDVNINKNDNIKSVEKKYVAYININPLIKLEFKEKCILEETKDGNSVYNCEEPKVTNYVLINDDAKDIYSDIDFLKTGGVLYDVLNQIAQVARDEGIVFEKVNIKSDWSSFLDYQEEKKELISEWNFEIEIVNKEELENKKYTVTFNSNGGTEVDNQEVEENSSAYKPEIPSKSGYKFVEWQLDGKTYDFNTKVSRDIELVAVWVKIITTNETTTTKQITTTTKGTTTTKITTTEKVNDNYDKYDINLNDNVIYDVVHIAIINRLDNICLDRVKEQGYIMGRYNGYDYLTISPYIDNINTDYKEFYKILNECIEDISQSTLNSVTNIKGVKNEILWNQNRITTIETIRFNESKYENLSGHMIFNPEKYGLIYFESFAFGWQEPALLNEDICKQYNLKCSRW